MGSLITNVAKTLRGVIAGTGMALNTVVWCVPLFALTLIRILVPYAPFRRFISRVTTPIIDHWVSGNRVLLRVLNVAKLDVRGAEHLSRGGWYLVVCNHQSWADIVALQCSLRHAIPPIKFFTKKQLIWLPFLGQALWALDFPFMKRYSREEVERNPELRGKDLETTRRACEHFRDIPTSVLNFLEGTRFTPAKQQSTESPYQHLLPPKTGGFAFVVGALGDKLDQLVDITIVYPAGRPSFWDFLRGDAPEIILEITTSAIPDRLKEGDYQGDEVYRADFRNWVDTIWQSKDEAITRLLADKSVV